MNRCTLYHQIYSYKLSTHPWWWLQTGDVERISSTSQGDAVVCLGLWEFEHFVVRLSLSLFLTHIPTLHREPSKKNGVCKCFFKYNISNLPWHEYNIYMPLNGSNVDFFVNAAKQHEPPQSSLHSRMGHPKKTISVLPLVQAFSSQKKSAKESPPKSFPPKCKFKNPRW